MSTTARTLLEMYESMRAEFGRQGWWPTSAEKHATEGRPGDGALEICVGAILTQNTNWRNVEKAIANLRSAGLTSVSALEAKPQAELAELIRPAGYFNVKAKRLKNFIARVFESFGDDIEGFLDRPVEVLREELLSINGVGRETADSMILYAAGKPVFVVDAYTHRIALRHGLISPEDDYEAIRELFESQLPQDVALWNDFHAQLVCVGKGFCRPRAPACDACPLKAFPHDLDAGR